MDFPRWQRDKHVKDLSYRNIETMRIHRRGSKSNP